MAVKNQLLSYTIGLAPTISATNRMAGNANSKLLYLFIYLYISEFI